MTELPDDLASRLITRMVDEYEDDEQDGEGDFDVAFAAALDECHDDIPDGFGGDRVLEDLASRGWLRTHRGVEYETGNEEPLYGRVEIDEITTAGFTAGRAGQFSGG